MSIKSTIKEYANKYTFTGKFAVGMEKLIEELLPEAYRVKHSDYAWHNILIELRVSTVKQKDGVWAFRSYPIYGSDILVCLGATKENINIWCLHSSQIKTKSLRLKDNDEYSVKPEDLKLRVEQLSLMTKIKNKEASIIVTLTQDQIESTDKLAEIRNSNRSEVLQEIIDRGIKSFGNNV